jgi:Flp pilus assembly protein CpaB
MTRTRRLFVSLTAALVAAALVYAVYIVLLRQVEMQEKTHVIVPSRFIAPGTVITEEMLGVRPMLAASVDEQMVTAPEEVIGKQALIPLGAGEPILAWKLTSLMLLPRANESMFEIPKSYILAISAGIRPGERVRIYLSSETGGRRLLAEDVYVATVKLSNAGRDDSDPAVQADSLAGHNHRQVIALFSGQYVERIDLNLTEEQWLLIDSACREPENGRLVIALPGDDALQWEDVWKGAGEA